MGGALSLGLRSSQHMSEQWPWDAGVGIPVPTRCRKAVKREADNSQHLSLK